MCIRDSSRAIPEIDGFKPSHRKLLYTMYDMGLLTKARTKSSNVVGATMKLNPHGDAAIYDTCLLYTSTWAMTWVTPSSLPMASAVRWLSPVSMTTSSPS